MILRYKNYEDLASIIREECRNIVVYGAGMIGTVFVPYFIDEYALHDYLICYFDKDKKKQGNIIGIGKHEYLIKSPEELRKISADTIILITNSNYYPIVKMMDDIKELNQNEVYIIPILQVLSTHNAADNRVTHNASSQLIPKKIHYCWFSGNPVPGYLQKCIESWYKFCPDYEIIRWDESNYDVNKNLYMKQAYQSEKWGFVPDFARLDILFNEGGIYLDTDVELIRNIDELLYQKAFTGVEKWGNVNMGGCSGAVPKHPLIKKMLNYRINERFILNGGRLNQMTCGYYETIPLMQLGMKPNNHTQKVQDMTIYSSDFFQPYDYMSGEIHITDNTFSIHHFNGGWLDEQGMLERRKTTDLYKKMLRRMQVN